MRANMPRSALLTTPPTLNAGKMRICLATMVLASEPRTAAHWLVAVVPGGRLYSLRPSTCSGVVKYWAPTGALRRQTKSGTTPVSRIGNVKTKNCVITSRPNHRVSTVGDSPAVFWPGLSLLPNILANAASLARQMPMLANVLLISTGVAGEAPRARAMLSTTLAVAYVRAYTAQIQRNEADEKNLTGAFAMFASLLPIAAHRSFLPAALSVIASSMTATSGAQIEPAHTAAPRSVKRIGMVSMRVAACTDACEVP
mmetsp:Transcript_10104/g.25184  ORF Transcript_10104/g.25184 Transcript_10104/m.25184 type:complete len:256 (+) Transcript_10104:150-917(+)